MVQPGVLEIQSVLNRKGYKFLSQAYAVNLIGVRSDVSKSDQFDDFMHMIVVDRIGAKPVHRVFPCTTDPGKHWLLNPMNVMGTAIMVPGQYENAYTIGLHKNDPGHPCLRQTGRIRFVRDNNKDSDLDFSLYRDPTKLAVHGFWGNISANIHRAHPMKKALNVGKYSAACQVLRSEDDLDEILGHAQTHSMLLWPGITYTLLEESDFYQLKIAA